MISKILFCRMLTECQRTKLCCSFLGNSIFPPDWSLYIKEEKAIYNCISKITEKYNNNYSLVFLRIKIKNEKNPFGHAWGDPAWGGRLEQMTSRGPFQSQPFCDSEKGKPKGTEEIQSVMFCSYSHLYLAA